MEIQYSRSLLFLDCHFHVVRCEEGKVSLLFFPVFPAEIWSASHEGAEVLRYVYPYRGLHYVTMVFGKTQSYLSEFAV